VAGDRDLFSNESAPDLGISPKERPFAFVSRATPSYLLARVSTVQNELRAYYAPVSQLDQAKVDWKAICPRTTLCAAWLSAATRSMP
jgi:hypothetical protein